MRLMFSEKVQRCRATSWFSKVNWLYRAPNRYCPGLVELPPQNELDAHEAEYALHVRKIDISELPDPKPGGSKIVEEKGIT